ncbi:L-alanine-DL-glutamate epimerase-like enolase superfamily enzyme [Algoriphagus boseongensis]|uniref:Dipeptide epimerase n=1 Tax=Algoriphagus boseongensis TaxID=1442587 RepID=A0A4R6T405_9BACT|nr:dipeptide epimerase [Algoriphagus boseongensis]TDQ16983.1 L-alanine-DL-glutamate epimerase-like enolase superfamily enzyme [Algoriphagus boseongensis]
MKLSYQVFDLPLKHTFTIAHQSRDIQDTLIVKLEGDGFWGLGESTTNPFYGMTIENMSACLEEARPLVESEKWSIPEELWEMGKNIFKENPFAQCALDLAAWDWFTKKQGKKLYEYLNLDPKSIPLTNFTIGIDTVEKMVAKMKEVDWPIYKIKLGTPNDLEIVRELRKHTNSIFRIDANCAWTAEQAIRYSEELAKLGVEFMEQPLGKDDLEGMREVYKHSKLPVMADESCIVESDVKKCHSLFHAINVKLVKAGGITPGLRMIREAKSLGMKTMVGCMTESSVGITAIAHIAPLLDYVDMDGAMLLAKDPARGVQITPEKVTFPKGPGIGAELV